MQSTKFKYVIGILALLGLLITSCSNPTEQKNPINEVEYMPKVSEAVDLTQSLLIESFKTTAESFVGSKLINESTTLQKTNGGSSYHYFDNWHTWRGEIEASIFDIEDSYNAEYLSKIQFQDGTGTPQQPAEGAQLMLMYLNAHIAFGFVNNEPYGDEAWYDFKGAASPLNGWPTVINAGGTYERRWVGLLNDVDTELHYEANVGINNVQFFYDWNKNDFYLNGIVTVQMNGMKILVRFTNSRKAMLEIYQGGTLVQTSQFELPNYYEMMNIPSLDNWNFASGFIFPTPIVF